MKYFKITVMIAFFLLLHNNLLGQYTVIGRVVNNDSAYISYAIITITNEGKITSSTESDNNGKFSLSVPKGDYILNIYHDAVTTQLSIHVELDTDLGDVIIGDSDIEERSFWIDEAIIIGRKTVLSRSRDQLIFSVENSPLNNPSFDGYEVIKRTPILSANNEGNITFDGRPVVVSVNGNLVNLSGKDMMNYLKMFNATDIKTIQIATTASSEYDATVSGAVVNIITKSLNIGYNINLSSCYTHIKSNYYDNHENVIFNSGGKKFNIYGSYTFNNGRSGGSEYNATQDLLLENITYIRTTLSNQSKYNSHNYMTGLILQPSARHKIGLEFNGNRGSIPDSYNKAEFKLLRQDSLTAEAHESSRFVQISSLNRYTAYYTLIVDSLNSSLKLYAGGINRRLLKDNMIESMYLFGSITDSKETNMSDAYADSYYCQLDFTKNLRRIASLSTGGKFTNTYRRSGYEIIPYIHEISNPSGNYQHSSYNVTEKVLAAYLNSGFDMWEKKAFLRIGVRLEQTQLDGFSSDNSLIYKRYTDFFPTFTYNHRVAKNHDISFSGRRSISRPQFSVYNNLMVKISEFYYMVGNPELKPQYNNVVAISYRHKQHLLYSSFVLSENTIYTISKLNNDNTVYYITTNNGISRYLNLLYSYSGSFVKFWAINGSAQLSYVEIPQNITHTNWKNAILSLRNTFTITNYISFELSANYLSKYLQINSEVGQEYCIDFSYRHLFFKNRLSMQLNIDDILNSRKTSINEFTTYYTSNIYIKPLSQKIGLTLSFNFKSNKTLRLFRRENTTTYEDRLN